MCQYIQRNQLYYITNYNSLYYVQYYNNVIYYSQYTADIIGTVQRFDMKRHNNITSMLYGPNKTSFKTYKSLYWLRVYKV